MRGTSRDECLDRRAVLAVKREQRLATLWEEQMATGDRVDVSAADPATRNASFEQKMAVLNELSPYVLLMPRGDERARFEESVARRIGVSLQALRDETASRERSARNGKSATAADGFFAPRRRRQQAGG
jgi:hypothetical protein